MITITIKIKSKNENEIKLSNIAPKAIDNQKKNLQKKSEKVKKSMKSFLNNLLQLR